MNFRQPPPINQGTTVRIISPGAAVNATHVLRGKEYLESRGLRVSMPPSVIERSFYFAGTKESRAKELYEAFTQDGMVWGAKGGYGSVQVLEHGLSASQFEKLVGSLKQNPKWVIGFSDLTAINLGLCANAGILALHGPMIWNLRDIPQLILEEVWAILRGPEPITQVFKGGLRNVDSSRGILASGKLLGGKISVIASMVGANAMTGQNLLPDFNGCILLLEEVGEAAYKIHRYLSTILRSKQFNGVAGIPIGQLTSANEGLAYDAQDMIDELEPVGVPVITGINIGHESKISRPIVLGAMAEILGEGILKVKVPKCV
ncbi:peptidase family S66 [Crepidotus variabilis]|uniref:Peptidase family S66 n=1 Tax=Crepidotus variabilis TaxID=179855 RepID=A0A9P6EG57_9AGAR|nr:peptidase family S66 [Crepidotus variabilis]